MAWFSFHGGHSGEFCAHARGTLAEVVAAAAARGFTTYGLSEHAPRSRAEDLYPDEAGLTPDDLRARFRLYRVRARDLQAAWGDRLELLVGFELECVPPDRWAAEMRGWRDEGDFDFVVGSVHHLEGVPIDLDAATTERVVRACGGRDAFDRAYFDAVAAMIEASAPQVVGHLDLCRRFRGGDVAFADDTWPHVERALAAAAACDAVLDVNAAPARRGGEPVYPSVEILTLARLMGVGVTLGDDSHGPDGVGRGLEACVDAIRAAGYAQVACLHRRNGRVEQEFVPLDALAPLPAA
jgi:histidinol-phosphatase (PHP family)